MATPSSHPTQRPHLAAVMEDHVHTAAGRLLRGLGWRPRLETYTGYGTPQRVRVLARVLLAPRGHTDPERERARVDRRGFRHFLTVPASHEPVTVRIGDSESAVVSDRGGYVDVDLPVAAPLSAGTHVAVLAFPGAADRAAAEAAVVVLDESTRFGVVSDMDDTTMVTAVPRPLLAAWNTFVRHSSARRAVPGMAELYRTIQRAHPDAAFFYLSTGAWNTAGTLRAFLSRHAFPLGPLLLTDWGPTHTGWFRSGPVHKRASLELLMTWFPHVRWVLVGDDGQHDVAIYQEVARRRPERVRAVAIRQLTGGQQVLAGNAPHAGGRPQVDAGSPGSQARSPAGSRSGAGAAAWAAEGSTVPVVAGPDGDELARRLVDVPGVLDDRDPA